MPSFLVNMYAIIEAENEREAEEVAQKIVNSDFPEEIDSKIETFTLEDDITEVDEEGNPVNNSVYCPKCGAKIKTRTVAKGPLDILYEEGNCPNCGKPVNIADRTSYEQEGSIHITFT